MRYISRLALPFLAFLAASIAMAAPPLSSLNVPLLSANLSGTIAATNTFQPIQGQTNNRQGCTIQNLGTHTMYVYFGTLTSASASNSIELAATQALNCAVSGGSVLIDAVSITGTSGDAFYANFQ